MHHVVLLGDSIFDNARYVPGDPPVIEQLRTELPRGWRATLLAVDGSITDDVTGQLARLPADVTHLIVSAGGNDALEHSAILAETVYSVGEALGRLAAIRDEFRRAYRRMLTAVLAASLPTAVCTVYDSIPGMDQGSLTALATFNDCITREAVRAQLPIVDLRVLCDRATDYSSHSPIEPSVRGGEKIARAIAGLITRHDFTAPRTVVYG
jgi:GDSL-like Lipase/Acylhydrolase family